MTAQRKLTGRVGITDAFGELIAGTAFEIRVDVPGGSANACGGYRLTFTTSDMAVARREAVAMCKRFLDELFPPA